MAIGPTVAMTIRLPVEMAAELKLVADCDGEPVIGAIRAAIETWIDLRRNDPNFQEALARHISAAQKLALPTKPGA